MVIVFRYKKISKYISSVFNSRSYSIHALKLYCETVWIGLWGVWYMYLVLPLLDANQLVTHTYIHTHIHIHTHIDIEYRKWNIYRLCIHTLYIFRYIYIVRVSLTKWKQMEIKFCAKICTYCWVIDTWIRQKVSLLLERDWNISI